jgi:oxygen-independent coproporphyrinogen-3 oxidase
MTLGVYIQVPFCQTKCTYCNFHTGVVSRDRYQPYAKAICREIKESSANFLGGWSFSSDIKPQMKSGASAPEENSPVIDTVYFGGGTPSLLEPAALAKVLATLRENFSFVAAPNLATTKATRHSERSEEFAFSPPEITLEADPETITPEKSQAWLAAGFNRISLGSQSFNDAELIASGRMHRRTDIHNAVKILRAAGFANISLDLIAGLPHQTRDTWEQSITETLTLRPEHISIYMLEIDEGSRLGRESLAGGARYSAATIPSDDATAEFYESACERLAAGGYDHYEISNWALPGRRSRHNLKYWRREPYLGLGAGAHSFDGCTRWANLHDSASYVAHIEKGDSPREQIEAVTAAQALEEEFFLGLRQLEGIDFARIGRDYSANGQRDRVATIRTRIATLSEQGVVEFDGHLLRLSPSRLTISNEVLVALLE